MSTAVISVRVPPKVRDVLQNLSRETGWPQARLVQAAILHYAHSPQMAKLKEASQEIALGDALDAKPGPQNGGPKGARKRRR